QNGISFNNFITSLSRANDTVPTVIDQMIRIHNPLFIDTVPLVVDTSIMPLEKWQNKPDSLADSLRIPISKDTLSGTVAYHADDSMVLNIPGKTFHLYGKTTTKFNDIDLKAARMDFDQATNLLKARFVMDSGRRVGAPIFSQKGQDPFQSDSMVY